MTEFKETVTKRVTVEVDFLELYALDKSFALKRLTPMHFWFFNKEDNPELMDVYAEFLDYYFQKESFDLVLINFALLSTMEGLKYLKWAANDDLASKAVAFYNMPEEHKSYLIYRLGEGFEKDLFICDDELPF